MKRTCLIATALAATWGTCDFTVAGSRPARARNDADAAAKETVQGVLAAERDGSVTNRARRLRAALRTSPQFAPAQWQSGRVNVDGEWVPVHASISRIAANKMLKEYRAQRDKTPKTLAGQMELAAWCLKQKLYPQQRAHLTAALEINPNHLAARKALGHVRVGRTWMSRDELQQRRREAAQAEKELRIWGPKIGSIRDALTSGSRLRYQQGLQRLKAIDDPAAIPAIELGLAYSNSEQAAHVVDYLGEQRHRDSTVALARQGIFSPWKTVRERAAGKLKRRRFDDFVPAVLALTSTPVQSKQLLYVGRRGSLFYRHVFGRETRDFKALGLVGFNQRAIPVRRRPTNAGRVPGVLARELNRLSGRDAAQRRTQRVRDLAKSQELLTERLNQTVAEWNVRACSLLATATGQSCGDDARAWWKWWDEYSDSTQYAKTEYKPEVRYAVEATTYEEVPLPSRSCLAAGTPVWTDRGPVAIDKVKIGDRVLSQNVETGELDYKPVLKTTVRPQRPLIALEIGPRTVHLTPGHPFWIPGRGWTRARDIKAGMLLHDVTGTTAARPAGTAPAAPTYNLIVADFHTYFVGETKVLSHDVTTAEPTDVLVPGLLRSAGGKVR